MIFNFFQPGFYSKLGVCFSMLFLVEISWASASIESLQCDQIFQEAAILKKKTSSRKREKRPDAVFELSPLEKEESQTPEFVEFIDPATDPEFHQDLEAQDLRFQKQNLVQKLDEALTARARGPYQAHIRSEEKQTLVDFFMLPYDFQQILVNSMHGSSDLPHPAMMESLQMHTVGMEKYIQSIVHEYSLNNKNSQLFQKYDLDVLLGNMIRSLMIVGLGPLSYREAKIQDSFIYQYPLGTNMSLATKEYVSFLQIPRELLSLPQYQEGQDTSYVLAYLLLLGSVETIQKMHTGSFQNLQVWLRSSAREYQPTDSPVENYHWELLGKIHRELFKNLQEFRLHPSSLLKNNKSQRPLWIQGFKTAFRTAMMTVAEEARQEAEKKSNKLLDLRRSSFQGWSHFIQTYKSGVLENKQPGAFGMDFQAEDFHPKTIQ